MRASAERQPKPEPGICQAEGCGAPVEPVPCLGKWIVPDLCPECAERAEHEMQAEAVRARALELLEISNLPPRAREWSFRKVGAGAKAFGMEAALRPAIEEVFGWRYGPRGLYLHGRAGTGKTVLAWCLLGRTIRQELKPCFFLDVPNFLAELRKGFGDRSAGRDWQDRAKKASLLCLDDLGAERPTEWSREILFGIVNHRLNHNLPTVVTSNHDPAGLYDHIGDKSGRLVNRLVDPENFQLVTLPGDGFRLKRAKGGKGQQSLLEGMA